MSDFLSDATVSEPILVPFRRWPLDVIWGVFTLSSALAAVGAVITAGTSGGQIVGGLIFGAGCLLCLVGWSNMRRHPAQLMVTDEAIVRGDEGRPKTTWLLKATSPDLALVLLRSSRSGYWALAQAGNDTRLDVQGFKKEEIERACLARGWRFPG